MCSLTHTLTHTHTHTHTHTQGFGAAEPHKILVDDLPLSGGDTGQLFLSKYSTKTLYAQWLPGPEPKTDPKSVVVQLVRWSPASWRVGPWQEMLVGAEESVDEVRERLEETTGISKEAVRLGKSSCWAGTPRDELEALSWNQVW